MLTKKPRIRKLIYFLSIALLLQAILLIIWGIWPYKKALFTNTKNWQQLNELIMPHITIESPVGEGPYPVVLVIPGCEGVYPERAKPRMRWLADHGYMAVMVDSHKGRELNEKDVCSGKALWGRERAGDIYVALYYVRTLAKADINNIALLGYSHGGWSILDALSYDGETSYGLNSVPNDILRAVKGAVVYYPYCDFPSRARFQFNSKIPLLALHAGADTTVNAKSCETMMRSWQKKSLTVTSITYSDVGHGFDIRAHNSFVPDIHSQALDEIAVFLQTVFPTPEA